MDPTGRRLWSVVRCLWSNKYCPHSGPQLVIEHIPVATPVSLEILNRDAGLPEGDPLDVEQRRPGKHRQDGGRFRVGRHRPNSLIGAGKPDAVSLQQRPRLV